MKDEMQFSTSRLAVLLDADNAKASLIESLSKEIAKYGTANVKRIYGNWTSPNLVYRKKNYANLLYDQYNNLAIRQGKFYW
jgi:hypothetical protein